MLERVAGIISRYNMFATGEKAGVAVSGGPDSVALLHILAELAPRWNLKLLVLHVNHLLRGEESRGDAHFVRELSERLGLPVEIKEVDVAELARQSGDNLEQAARRARYSYFSSFLESGALTKVALGHTRSDQAETVLFRLLRGSGTKGLAGIWPVTGDGIVRPLIGLAREEIIAFLRSRGLEWREDATNDDERFARNRIRHRLLPQLRREWNPKLTEGLANLATIAHGEEVYWQKEVARLAGNLLVSKAPAVLLRADRLIELPDAAARRLIRRAVELAKGDTRRLQFEHVERVLELAKSRQGDGRVGIPGLEVARSFEWVRFSPREERGPDYRIALHAPGRFRIPGTDTAIFLELLEQTTDYLDKRDSYNTDRGSVLDLDRSAGALELRNFRPGDRFWPAGGSGPAKIKALFHQSRVPSWERPGWPVVTVGEAIVWVRHFGVAQGWTPGPGSERILRLKEVESGFAESKG